MKRIIRIKYSQSTVIRETLQGQQQLLQDLDHRLHLSSLQWQKAELTSSKTQISSANDTESYIFEPWLLATACPEMSLIRMRMLRGWYSSSFKLEITRQNA